AIVAVDGKTVGVKNRVKAAVAGFEIKGASVGLERELSASLPNAAEAGVGRDIEDALKDPATGIQLGDVPGSDPAVVGAVVAMRSPGDIHRVVDQAQGDALVLAQHVKLDHLLSCPVVRIENIAVAAAVHVD